MLLLAAPLIRRLCSLFPDVAEQGSKHDDAARAATPEWDRARVPANLADEEAEHRLANLFQLVVFDLNHAARSSDGAARLAIDAAAGQVTDLGRLYQMLGGSCRYREGCGDHLRALGKALEALVLSPRGHSLMVEVAGEAAAVFLPTAALRCLSQIVVELVINAAKHAFPAGPGGCVVLRLAVAGEYVSCSIIDNGVGYGPADSQSDSRGMRLVSELVEHGGGRCRWVFGSNGTDVRVLLPLDQSCVREILLDAQSVKV